MAIYVTRAYLLFTRRSGVLPNIYETPALRSQEELVIEKQQWDAYSVD